MTTPNPGRDGELLRAIAHKLCEHHSIGAYPTRSWDEQPDRVRALCFEYAEGAVAALRTVLREHPETIAGLVDEDFNRHVYEITTESWFLEHSLACRLTGLANCPIHRVVETYEPPEDVGRYVVTLTDGELDFVREVQE